MLRLIAYLNVLDILVMGIICQESNTLVVLLHQFLYYLSSYLTQKENNKNIKHISLSYANTLRNKIKFLMAE
jgi:hypothetical protein